MEQQYINHSQYDVSFMAPSELIMKQSKPKMRQGETSPYQYAFQVIPLEYNYVGDDTYTVVSPLTIELPELYAPHGITTYSDGRKSDLFTVFDMRNREVRDFCSMGTDAGTGAGAFHTLFIWALNRVWKVKAQIPVLNRLSSKEHLEMCFGYPIRYKRDSATGKVSNANPTCVFPLLDVGTPGTKQRRETQFHIPVKDATGNYITLTWEQLKGFKFTYKPVVLFRDIYIIGGKCRLTFEITTAVITGVYPLSYNPSQKKTLDEYAANKRVKDGLVKQFCHGEWHSEERGW